MLHRRSTQKLMTSGRMRGGTRALLKGPNGYFPVLQSACFRPQVVFEIKGVDHGRSINDFSCSICVFPLLFLRIRLAPSSMGPHRTALRDQIHKIRERQHTGTVARGRRVLFERPLVLELIDIVCANVTRRQHTNTIAQTTPRPDWGEMGPCLRVF